MIKKEKIVGKSINAVSWLAPRISGKIAVNLMCLPLEGRIYEPGDQQFLDDAEKKVLLSNGKKVQCYRWGSGKIKVLLAHGFNSNAARWRLLIRFLLKTGKFEISALDCPAHGHSEGNFVNGLLYAQALEKAIEYYRPQHLVGHSFAGIGISYYLAEMTPLPVEKVVLMGVPNRLDDVTKLYFNMLGFNQQVQNAYYRAFERQFGKSVDYFTLSNFVKKIPQTGLVIHDYEDEIVPFAGAQEIQQNWSSSFFLATQNLGHKLQSTEVYHAIYQFLS